MACPLDQSPPPPATGEFLRVLRDHICEDRSIQDQTISQPPPAKGKALMQTITATLRQVFTLRWNPNKDLAVVALSWVLVVGALFTATVIVGQAVWGGMAYFFLYAVVGAALCGVGIPLYWMTVVRRRSIADLGLTKHWLGRSLVLQLVLAAFLYVNTLAKVQLPPSNSLCR
jgi:hypothetical protein